MITEEIMQKLAMFAGEATGQDFNRIFGQLGPHLFAKFADRCSFDLLALWTQLDAHHRALLIHALNEGQ